MTKTMNLRDAANDHFCSSAEATKHIQCDVSDQTRSQLALGAGEGGVQLVQLGDNRGLCVIVCVWRVSS